MSEKNGNYSSWRRLPGPVNGEPSTIITPPPTALPNLIVSRIAQENISALTLVTALNKDDIVKASYDTFNNANVLGVALNSAGIGGIVNVVIFGEVRDSFFTFPLNAELFLGNNGVITTSDPSPNFVTHIGHSLGDGAIIVDIEVPINIE